MPQPFRFGIQLSALPSDDWARRVQRIEELGYSTLFVPDHFGKQWDPTVLMAAAAAVTRTLRVGTLVYDVDYRHPVVHAKIAATLHLVSGGRHEFGIGAGWMKSDYDEAGISYDPPGVRISRLEEALQICHGMWTQKRTSFEGEHYRITNIDRAAPLAEGERPRVLIGGGGRRVLSIAGRYADIVGINPTMSEGRITSTTASDLTFERTLEKIGWARAAAEKAGRDPDAIEFNSLVFVVALTDDPRPIREGLAQNSGMTVEEIAGCPLFLTGSPQEVCDSLQTRREKTGINYVVIQGRDEELIERFAAEVVKPLAGR